MTTELKIILDFMQKMQSTEALNAIIDNSRWEEAQRKYLTKADENIYIGSERLARFFIRTFFNLQGNALPQDPFNLLKLMEKASTRRSNVMIINNSVAIKVNLPVLDRNDTYHEGAVGIYINWLMENKLPYPNFVYTIGAFKANGLASIERGMNDKLIQRNKKPSFSCHQKYDYIATVMVNGHRIIYNQQREALESYMPIYLQVIMAMRTAFEYCGITHYDLHGGNVIVHKIPGGMKQLNYAWGGVKTEYYATIIDFGRSCVSIAGVSYGREINHMGIKRTPNFFYDVYFYLWRTLPKSLRKNKDILKIVSFFGLNGFNDDVFKDMTHIANRTYDWPSFLQLLISLDITRNIFIPNQNINTTPIEAKPVISPDMPNDASLTELETWLKFSNNVKVRAELLSLIIKDQDRVEKFRRIYTQLNKLGPGDVRLKGFDMKVLTENKHEEFYDMINKAIASSGLMEYRKIITPIITYYQSRIKTWTQLLRDRFGG